MKPVHTPLSAGTAYSFPASSPTNHQLQTLKYEAGGVPNCKVLASDLQQQVTHSSSWDPALFLAGNPGYTRKVLTNLLKLNRDGGQWDPMAFHAAFSAKSNSPDIYTWHEAMNSPH